MREIITIHIAQAGIQFGNSSWEQFCLEHGIQRNGHLINEKLFSDNSLMESFFLETESGKYITRSIFLDLEPTSLDEIRIGNNRNLYKSEQLVYGNEGSSHIYARGYCTTGRNLIDLAIEKIRKLADDCNDLQGFIIYNAVGGGTGSGFGSLLLERLSIDYSGKLKLGFIIYPSFEMSNIIVEPYNSVFSTHNILEHLDVSVMFDNSALYKICKRHLDIEKPTYLNMNRLISQVVSTLTASIRFGGALNVELNEFQTNLVPYPRVSFMLTSYAPIIPSYLRYYEPNSVGEITHAAFEHSSMMVDCNPNKGKYMACSVIFRGDFVPRDISASIGFIKSNSKINFVDWCSTGFRCGLNYNPPTVVPGGEIAESMRAICMISNSSSISQAFSRINYKFDLMYTKRGFVHWYVGEGIEEEDFHVARVDLASLEKDYEEIEKSYVDPENNLDS